jgi:hypothetical protein
MMMDTTKLVVGQNVSLVGAAWSLRGKVVRFTPEGVEVYVKKLGTYLFDNEGRGSDEGCPLVLKAVIDMKTLVVGQNVSMSSGCYRQFGKVAKVTPEGVEVQVHPGGGKRDSITKAKGVRETVRLNVAFGILTRSRLVKVCQYI